jgi:hypothetical protein
LVAGSNPAGPTNLKESREGFFYYLVELDSFAVIRMPSHVVKSIDPM